MTDGRATKKAIAVADATAACRSIETSQSELTFEKSARFYTPNL
jgi:hypothetical protein